ncbi:hypothetical protein OB919_20155 [Halobacteria archaeon AArc-curdl1]|uniref:Uncharacterized protein n=1 Tax=Natronosalvus hydrolyticus TaxID=2979988 RepID=A0AAP2ZE29_9EURY|nr:hypothetical protein [Halobacteria archaeon AArc-curdl1]
MTPSTLHITVDNRDTVREDAPEVVRAIDSTDSKTTADEAVPDHLRNPAMACWDCWPVIGRSYLKGR